MILQFWGWCFGHPKGDTGFPLVSNCANVLTVESEGNYISPLTNTDCGSWMLLGPYSLSSLFKALFPPLLFPLYLPVAACLITQSCPTLCDPMDYSLPGSSVHGIFQARVLEWVAISFSRASSQPRDQMQVSRIAGRFLTS